MEIWNGRRAGVEGAVATYGATRRTRSTCSTRSSASTDRPAGHSATGSATRVRRPDHEAPRRAAAGPRARPAGTGRGRGSGPLLAELRLRRSPAELERHRRACAISRERTSRRCRYARPGLYEYQVQAALDSSSAQAARRANGYPSIVASGPNACILHYSENSRRMEDGDLLLIDAGCE